MNLLYAPPSKWYRRYKKITITIWPNWLAKTLCKHNIIIITMKTEKYSIGQCQDCYSCFNFDSSYWNFGNQVSIKEQTKKIK